MTHTHSLFRNFLAIVLIVLLNSCSNDEGRSINFVSMEIDGVLWETNNAVIVSAPSPSTFIFTLTAFDGDGELLQLEIIEFTAPRIGSFAISSGAQNNVIYSATGQFDVNALNALSCPNVTGDITITNIDDVSFSGTFQANVCGPNGQQIIRNGVFNNVFIQ